MQIPCICFTKTPSSAKSYLQNFQFQQCPLPKISSGEPDREYKSSEDQQLGQPCSVASRWVRGLLGGEQAMQARHLILLDILEIAVPNFRFSEARVFLNDSIDIPPCHMAKNCDCTTGSMLGNVS
jgi:hypothetical protein